MSFTELIGSSLDFIFFILPIILPIIFIKILFDAWVDYAREKFLSEQTYSLLKITPPRDVFKTPAAMELFLGALYQTGGESTPIDRYWKGKSRAWFSLEIASHEGSVNFYIWTRKNLVGYVQSQIFAQYSGIEVQEVQDYTEKIDYDSGNYNLFGAEFKLTQPDPVPIKTYVDYGLDKQAVEEYEKIDPITPTIEFLGSMGKGEHVWIQIITRAHKDEDKDPKKWLGKTDLWKDEAKELIKKIQEETLVSVGEGEKKTKVSAATKGQIDKISAIERSISKLPFDIGIRSIYIAEKDIFNPVNNGGLTGSFKQYNSLSLNGFKPSLTTSFDYFWEDFFGRKLKKRKKDLFKYFKERKFFGLKKRKKFVLNSEELATIFHFPGGVSVTPSLDRVQAKKSEAPADLPI